MTQSSTQLTAYKLQPLTDPRWNEFLRRHPRATIFHTAEWLEAIRRTYGYEPIALTTCPAGSELRNALVFCRVKSWLAGECLISLPFSDHCDPLVETDEEVECLLSALKHELGASKAKRLEIRPISLSPSSAWDLEKADGYCFHELDLRPSLDEIHGAFHKDCVSRKIRRAEREQLEYEEGVSESLLARFYRLLVLSRRRQCLPPQPLAWFRNLIACLGDRLKIRVASKDGHPVASILTLRFKDTLVYKYGCSDRALNHLGGMQLLFWKSIQEAKADGLTRFDLGRSDWDNPGLITFKDRWGARQSVLEYRKLSKAKAPARSNTLGWKIQLARQIVGHLPPSVLPLTGSLVYRHIHLSRS